MDLFGGAARWAKEDFTSSDDRVRGGSSRSHLDVNEGRDCARFYGLLDTKTLGGAGFASQRTVAQDKRWDLAQYDGIELVLARGDGHDYTLNLKTELPNKRPDGRDQSTVEYAFSFRAQDTKEEQTVYAPWSAFRPFYRGREQPDAKPLDPAEIRRWSFMIRSFFDQQDGPFDIRICRISAIRSTKPSSSVWSMLRSIFC